MQRAMNVLCGLVVFAATFASLVALRTSMIPVAQERLTAEDREGLTGAMESLDFWTRSRAYPDRDIPSDRYYRAYADAKRRQREISSVMTAGGSWDPIGPVNLQGRCISVALNPLNPSSVYAGTASGGLWRSYTGGLGGDWKQVKLAFPALGISAIVIDPVDSNTFYLGTGEVYRYQAAVGGLVLRTTRGSYGIGILKTADNGNTWTKSLDWTYNQRRGVHVIKLNPLNHRTLWAGTTEGLLKSTDAGATWNGLLSYGVLLMAEDIAINRADTNKVLVSIGNLNPASAIWRTTDGGGNWTSVFSNGYTGKTLLDVYEAHPNVVYASAADSTTGVGALWRTTDFGDSWVKLSDQNTLSIFGQQGWYSHFVIVHPADSGKIIHAAVSVGKSTDGGRTFNFSSGFYSDNHAFARHPADPNIIYEVNDDGIYRTTDFGGSFASVGSGMQTGQLYNGFSNSSQDSLFAVTQSQDHIPGYLYHGSPIWDRGAIDEVGWTAVDPTNDHIVYTDNRSGSSVCRSNDRGVSFPTCTSFGAGGAWNSPFGLSRSNPAILYFANQRAYKSTNGGTSWSVTNAGAMLDGNPALSMAIAPANPDTVFVGLAPFLARAHLFRTVNGGTSWSDVTGTLPDRYPLDVAVDPNNSQVVYSAFGGFGTGHLFKSTSAGSSWTDITGSLPDMPTTAVAIDPLHSNDVYVGNDMGVYASTDGGSTWSGFSEGLPDAVVVSDLTISPANRALRVATHGNGAYERRLIGELPANFLDVKAAQLVAPGDRSFDNLGVTVTPIRASFRNIGATAVPDSFNVKYRILHGPSEVYSDMRRIKGLSVGETGDVTFSGGFTPPDTGVYTLQAISLVADQFPSDDTLKGSLTILTPSTVASFVVNKLACPYTEITGGAPGPAGDDSQSVVALPFPFQYDRYVYDSAQISTNGWMEFGAGPRGSLRGLSSAGQVGLFFVPVMATTNRPTKALGPWWSDLYTVSSTTPGVISYATQGSPPNRVFVVQWKGMLPCCSDVNATRINFQIRLHETTNIVEYDYGPAVLSSFDGNGASMGMKDYVGGDYRYYDLALGGTGLATDARTNLLPATGWPGADSCFQIDTNIPSVTVSLSVRWNLVSLPLNRSDQSVASIYPTAVAGKAFLYNGSYQVVDSLKPGKGYWARFPSAGSQPITGSAMPSETIPVETGWNLIGSVDHEVPVPSGGLIVSRVFGYDGGYQVVTSLKPGGAYWIKTSASGSLPIGPAAAPKSAAQNPEWTGRLTIADSRAHSQQLFLAEENGVKNGLSFGLPPLPPEGAFDARFASNKWLEVIRPQQNAVFPLRIESADFPLTVSYEINARNQMAISLEEIGEAGPVAAHTMSGSGKVVIRNPENLLRVRISRGAAAPKEFNLSQNFPNPFNPATTIAFDVARKTWLRLAVYDVLGRRVMTLAEGEYEPGSYAVRVDFSALASGIYLYRLEAGAFTRVRKLLLTR